MGYSSRGLNRIIDDRSLFKGKDILTLGVLYPTFSNKERNRLTKMGLNLDCPKENFSKQLFIENLGAKSCESLDIDDYQGAELLTNLNKEMPPDFHEKYDIVVDLGTLEHLSNVPIALNNIFSLIRPNGAYYFGLPCNNWVDHGFFQFSPTFFKDLCYTNQNIVLKSCMLEFGNTLQDVATNDLIAYSAYASRNKTAVLGEIKKLFSDEINFDLSQEKYRMLYAKGNKLTSDKVSFYSRLKTRLVKLFISNTLIPFTIKKLLIMLVNLVKRK